MQASDKSSPNPGPPAATGALVASVHSMAVGLTMGTYVAVETSDGNQTEGVPVCRWRASPACAHSSGVSCRSLARVKYFHSYRGRAVCQDGPWAPVKGEEEAKRDYGPGICECENLNGRSSGVCGSGAGHCFLSNEGCWGPPQSWPLGTTMWLMLFFVISMHLSFVALGRVKLKWVFTQCLEGWESWSCSAPYSNPALPHFPGEGNSFERRSSFLSLSA